MPYDNAIKAISYSDRSKETVLCYDTPQNRSHLENLIDIDLKVSVNQKRDTYRKTSGYHPSWTDMWTVTLVKKTF